MKKRLLALFLMLSFVFPYMTWAAPSALANEESEVNEAKEARETREATEEKEGNTAKEAGQPAAAREELPRPCHLRPAAHGFYVFPRIPRKF